MEKSQIEVGNRVMVPRTGGGKSLGVVLNILGNSARVRFPVGTSYQGKASPIQFMDAGRGKVDGSEVQGV